MGFLLSLTKTVTCRVSSTVLAVIETIDRNTTKSKTNPSSNGPKTESDQVSLLELYAPTGLAGIYDADDEDNKQQAILIGRFYGHLAAQDLPDDLIEQIVQMITKMQFNYPITQVDFSDDEDY